MVSSSPFTLLLPDAAATQALGQQLGQRLGAGTVLWLVGELGSGKTSLTQGIGLGLGITEAITSPTFTLIAEYHEGRLPLYHFDLYRLDAAGADQLHLESYWEGEEVEPGILAIEWPERLPYRPERYLQIQLLHLGESRQVQFVPVGAGWDLATLLQPS